MRAAARNSLIALALAAVVAGAVLVAVFALRKKEGYALDASKYYRRHGKTYLRSNHKLVGMQTCRRNGQCNSGRCTNGKCECTYPPGSNMGADGKCLPGYTLNFCGGCYPANA